MAAAGLSKEAVRAGRVWGGTRTGVLTQAGSRLCIQALNSLVMGYSK